MTSSNAIHVFPGQSTDLATACPNRVGSGRSYSSRVRRLAVCVLLVGAFAGCRPILGHRPIDQGDKVRCFLPEGCGGPDARPVETL